VSTPLPCFHFREVRWADGLALPQASNSANPQRESTSAVVYASTSIIHSSTSWPLREEQGQLTPEDLDDEELEAYAEEAAQRAALADFEDISEDDLFSWSDIEELESNLASNPKEEDANMDTS